MHVHASLTRGAHDCPVSLPTPPKCVVVRSMHPCRGGRSLTSCWIPADTVTSEYNIPYPAVIDTLQGAFSWTNLNVFELVEPGCKVCHRWCIGVALHWVPFEAFTM